jgi:hypothetical protein
MRGDGDLPMAPNGDMAENIALLEKIVAGQRAIIVKRMGGDATRVPQDWALYKEVQEYYEKGMRVPADVTLLWCDDNWGNLRRVPTPEERKRSGGAGIYYHFDYVGDPRNYKWLNTVPVTKVWEQMNLAYRYGATRIWIVNVGNLKPMEFPIEFFLSLAWNPGRWPHDKIAEFGTLWAEREFGPAHAAEIADIIARYMKYNGRRKPELLEPGTFSLENYQESDRVEASWKAIAGRAGRIYSELPGNAKDAFFELVLYPTTACALVNELYIAAAKNRLYAAQGRASVNDYAARVRQLFQADADLSAAYNHTVAGGKWDHMMDQTHIGYTGWQQPPRNIMPAITEIQVGDAARMGVAVEGSSSAWPGAPGDPVLPRFDVFNQSRHYIDVFNRGRAPFVFSATAGASWIVLSEARGRVEKDRRLWVRVEWKRAPGGPRGEFRANRRTRRRSGHGAGGILSSSRDHESVAGRICRSRRLCLDRSGALLQKDRCGSGSLGKDRRLRPDLIVNGDLSLHRPEYHSSGEFSIPRIPDVPVRCGNREGACHSRSDVEFCAGPRTTVRHLF